MSTTHKTTFRLVTEDGFGDDLILYTADTLKQARDKYTELLKDPIFKKGDEIRIVRIDTAETLMDVVEPNVVQIFDSYVDKYGDPFVEWNDFPYVIGASAQPRENCITYSKDNPDIILRIGSKDTEGNFTTYAVYVCGQEFKK